MVDTLTREQIDAMRRSFLYNTGYNETKINTLCDLALRGLDLGAQQRAAKENERLRQWQKEMVEIQASGGRLNGYRELGAKCAALEAALATARRNERAFHDLLSACQQESSISQPLSAAIRSAIAVSHGETDEPGFDTVEELDEAIRALKDKP